MAKKVLVVCDVCERSPARTYNLSVDEERFTVDLCEEDAACLVKIRDAANGGSSPTRVSFVSPADPKTIREWAAKNGYDVAPKGKISTEVLMAYQRSQR